MWSHLETLLLDKATFWTYGWSWMLGRYYSTYYTFLGVFLIKLPLKPVPRMIFTALYIKIHTQLTLEHCGDYRHWPTLAQLKNPGIIFDSPKLNYSHPLVYAGDWVQDPLRIPKSTDAKVPYVKWCRTMHWSAGGGIPGCKTQEFGGLTAYLLEKKNPHINWAKPMLLKGHLYVE